MWRGRRTPVSLLPLPAAPALNEISNRAGRLPLFPIATLLARQSVHRQSFNSGVIPGIARQKEAAMHIELKCYATLSRFTPKDADRHELPDGTTVGQVIDRLGMAPGDVKLIFVNGVKAELDTRLKDGDRLGLFPAVGGG